MDINKIREEFDGKFVKEKYSGADGFLSVTGAYEDVFAFITDKLLQVQKETAETIINDIPAAWSDGDKAIVLESLKEQLRNKYLL